MTGRFITFEGGEGTGKSTQVAALVARLRSQGLEVVQTREPGGSAGAEALRQLLVKGEAGRWSPLSETLLIYAARADHLEQTIRPALRRGAWVVCDRFSDSTRAYQGAASGVSPDFIEQLDQAVVGKDQPDLTLILDMPSEAGLRRALARDDDETRFESKGLDFHERLRQGFIEQAATDPHRYQVINADRPIAEVSEDIWRIITRFIEAEA